MKSAIAVLALCSVSLSFPVASVQEATPPTHDRDAVVTAARDLMTAARFCGLVTMGEDGQPQARTVDPFEPEPDMTVWIATSPKTRKVRQIRNNPRVTLYYFDAAGPGYVTLIGHAEMRDDPAEKAARWKEDWAALYKDRNRGDDYVLIRVRPVRLEIVSSRHKLLNDPGTWRPVTVEFSRR